MESSTAPFNKTTIQKLVSKSKNVEKYKEYKRNMPEKYILPYDDYIIDDFIQKRPEEVEKIKEDLIKKEYWLKYNNPLLIKKLRKTIVPPLLKNEITPTGTVINLGDYDYDIPTYTFLKRDGKPLELMESKYCELDRVLKSLNEEDSLLIKMKFGLKPFDKEYKYVDIVKFFTNFFSGCIPKCLLYTIKEEVLSEVFDNIQEDYLEVKNIYLKNTKMLEDLEEFDELDKILIFHQKGKKLENTSSNSLRYLNNAYLSKRVKELLFLLKHPLSLIFGSTILEEDLDELDEETFNEFEGNVFL